jgi:hyperosmotically inducible protein
MNRLSKQICALAFAAGVLLVPAQAQQQQQRDRMKGQGLDRVTREVRHELVMLPYYGVFDNLAFRVDGSTVTLLGQVTRPTLKSDAENVVKGIEGVERVQNEIQVLPLSSMDDRIRIATYRAIFGQPGLDRYAMQAVPPIHIIVDNGKVTLEGVVANQGDKDRAGIQANGVSGVFSVTNNLRVENQK